MVLTDQISANQKIWENICYFLPHLNKLHLKLLPARSSGLPCYLWHRSIAFLVSLKTCCSICQHLAFVSAVPPVGGGCCLRPLPRDHQDGAAPSDPHRSLSKSCFSQWSHQPISRPEACEAKNLKSEETKEKIELQLKICWKQKNLIVPKWHLKWRKLASRLFLILSFYLELWSQWLKRLKSSRLFVLKNAWKLWNSQVMVFLKNFCSVLWLVKF